MNTIDIPVEITEEDAPLSGLKYRHPSYGMIKVSRVSGNSKLFGSDIEHSGYMKIVISEASVRQDLGRNWYFDEEQVIEVDMSFVQYAEMISSPNTQGMPCTIKWRQGEGAIKFKPPSDEIEHVEEKLKNAFDKAKNRSEDVIAKVEELFSKNSLNKKDKADIIVMISRIGKELDDDIPFYQESAKELLERRVMEAKAEVDCHVAHIQSTIGKNVLQNDELLTKLLSRDQNKEQ